MCNLLYNIPMHRCIDRVRCMVHILLIQIQMSECIIWAFAIHYRQTNWKTSKTHLMKIRKKKINSFLHYTVHINDRNPYTVRVWWRENHQPIQFANWNRFLYNAINSSDANALGVISKLNWIVEWIEKDLGPDTKHKQWIRFNNIV